MRANILILFVLFSYIMHSCSSEDEEGRLSYGVGLSYSVDTVSFGTLLTGFRSTTKQLKIYNWSGEDIEISRIRLKQVNSPFKLNINGVSGNEAMRLYLPAKDSIFIFVQVELIPQNIDEARLLQDKILIEANNIEQEIVIEVWAQDVYLVNEDIQNDQIWRGNRPYLVNKSIFVRAGATLFIEEGTHICFGKGAALNVKGNIQAEGSFENPILFSGTRFEELYEDIPGQWNGIYIYPESASNSFSHFELKNGITGISITGEENQPVQHKVEYGEVQNFVKNGISINNSVVDINNLLISNCGEHCLQIENSSQTEVVHCTLYNNWLYTPRTKPVVSIQNCFDTVTNCSFINTIIYGSHSNELELISSSNVSIYNCLVKLGALKQADYRDFFSACIFNSDPKFQEVENNNFTIRADSPCLNAGNVMYGTVFPFDLLNHLRILDEAPDIGGYEFFEEE